MIGCLRTCVRKQPIIALYFEFETALKFNNLEASAAGRCPPVSLVMFHHEAGIGSHAVAWLLTSYEA